jgi:probable addiction module antidote protein
MRKVKFRDYDVANYVKTEADILAYLEAAAEGGDARHFAKAIGDVTRARNKSAMARRAGMTRPGLYKGFLRKDPKPTLDSTMRLIEALGLRLSVQAASKPKGVKAKAAAK